MAVAATSELGEARARLSRELFPVTSAPAFELAGTVVAFELGRRLPRLPCALDDFPFFARGSHDGRWVVRLDARRNLPGVEIGVWSGEGSERRLEALGLRVSFSGERSIHAEYDPRVRGSFQRAIQETALGALRSEGRIALHAAAVVGAQSTDAVLLAGASGCGKSTLTLTALRAGFGFVSDDLVAAWAADDGWAVAPLRRSFAVPEDEVSRLPASAARGRWESEPGSVRKLRLDPQATGLAARHARARPLRLVFLERASIRSIEDLTPAQAYERLLVHCASALLDPGARQGLGLLRRLAEEIPARVARLTKACLSDARVLEALAA